MKRLLIVLLLLCGCVAGQAAQTPSWLEPSDALLQKAIDDGFAQKKLPKDARYHRYLNWIKPGDDARVEVIPPLFCALQSGQNAYEKLEQKPAIDLVKGSCLHRVTVVLVHYSPALKANWPCVFQKGEQTLQPTVKSLDDNPSVKSYYPGFGATQDQVGYRYFDVYTFEFPSGMADGATLTYADDRGQHKSLNYDFSVFAKDVTSK
jgi:hypothetical protein